MGYTEPMVSGIQWASFFPAALLLAATPGANQLLALRNGLRHGPRPAVGALAGRFSAFALMVVAVATGLGAVLTGSAVAFHVIKWCGVVCLVWLGGRTVLTAVRRRRGAGHTSYTEREAPPARGDGGRTGRRLARQEFVVAASNPKALLLFAVFLPQFLGNGVDEAAVPLLLLGAAYIAVEFLCACGYAALGGRLQSLGMTRRTRRALDACTGVAMLGLAGWLAAERR
ncbi:Homoserine/homoserine lactone efflux protein [Streptomyces sp. YIM 121038]|uniref:LysE family translocator n=1 Tax=Streptomyces sp. YIM 121038 TaxID=2136401 RepID=UPI0011648A07|nr:LysE family translocator [Streptomyces sp. YIM 121038]QCX81874.1 Homoserine/homoserine lactone efflux protein [Streptomyces sp. YIM 121038]